MASKTKIVLISFLLSILTFNHVYPNDKHDCISSKCGFHINFDKEAKEKFQRFLLLDDDKLPLVGQKDYISPNNLFKIHYDTVGFHAPNPTDKNQNNVPDYIDSVAFYFEYAYQKQVEEMGYLSPIPDRGGRGSDHYDIYIWDLGNSDDSGTEPYHPGGTYGLTLFQDSDTIAFSKFYRTYSFIVIDNDYSPLDSIRPVGGRTRKAFQETGIDALKITAAHEFQHAIQLIYGWSDPAPITIMEMCGVAMEFRLFPESKDYLQYVRNVFSNTSSYPFGVDYRDTGYGFSIWAKYLNINFGDNLLRKMWEFVGQNVELYSALKKSIEFHGSSFNEEWLKFSEWMYYTGSRAVPDKYFPEASLLPEMKFDKENIFSPPSIGVSKGTRPLEVGSIRFLLPANGTFSDDTVDVIYVNTDINSASKQYVIYNDYFFQISLQNDPGFEKLPLTEYFMKKDVNPNFIQYKIIEKPGQNTKEIDFAYPNPYNPNTDFICYFPSPKSSNLYDDATLIIYSDDMEPIITKKDKIGLDNGNRVFVLNESINNIANGTYFYAIHTKSDYSFGKFAILRK